jgi:hypothetical protein
MSLLLMAAFSELVWIEMDNADRLPISGGSTPALWMPRFGGLIDLITSAQQRDVDAHGCTIVQRW